jgi:hypothetical protein
VSDSGVQTAARAVARMTYVKSGGSFVCTGALINDRTSSFTPLFATAYHCISTPSVAATLETAWGLQPASCGGAPQSPTTRSAGAQLLATDSEADFTFLKLNQQPPGGSNYLGWSSSALSAGLAVFGIHHPGGTSKRYSAGTFDRQTRLTNNATGQVFGKLFNSVLWQQGTVEGGSSGSPLMSGSGTFRGTLFGSPSGDDCVNRKGFYSDFAQYYPLIASFLEGPSNSDDYPDGPSGAPILNPNAQLVAQLNSAADQDWFRFTFPTTGQWTIGTYAAGSTALDTIGRVYGSDGTTVIGDNDDRAPTDFNFEIRVRVNSPTTLYTRVTGYQGAMGSYGLRSTFVTDVDDHGNSMQTATAIAPSDSASGTLESAADEDWFRVSFSAAGTWSIASTGSTDTIGQIRDASGTLVTQNDDAAPPNTNFGMTISVQQGSTYYLRVIGFEGATGPYSLSSQFSGTASPTGANYTDLWWNPAENGWGINLNHQGSIIFATLFTYDDSGRDYWLVASNLAQQPDGSFTGTLYSTEGPPYFTQPWSAISLFEKGTMTLRFAAGGTATLVYNIGTRSVTKQIQRQRFSTAPTCAFVGADRSQAANYQDLWWNPTEPGWGLNIAHQGTTLFATLFDYDTDRLNLWLVASELRRNADGTYVGTLYRTRGPAFDAQPWTGVTVTPVGSMSIRFANGSQATLNYTFGSHIVNKQIARQVFANPPTTCN